MRSPRAAANHQRGVDRRWRDLLSNLLNPVSLRWPQNQPHTARAALAHCLLVNGILGLRDQLQRYEDQRAPHIAQLLSLLDAAQELLRSIAELPAAMQPALQAAWNNAQEEADLCLAELDADLQFTGWIGREMVRALESAEGAAAGSSMFALGRLCAVMFTAQWKWELCDELRDWMLKMDAGLSTMQADGELTLCWRSALLHTAIRAGALQLVPALMQQKDESGERCAALTSADLKLVTSCTAETTHFVSHQPCLRLFEFGLDPTFIDVRVSPLSALQMARHWIRDHPLTPSEAAELAAGAVSTTAAAAGSAETEPIPSILAAWETQQQEATEEAEEARRKALHSQFMHALLPAWLAHSTKVLSLCCRHRQC